MRSPDNVMKAPHRKPLPFYRHGPIEGDGGPLVASKDRPLEADPRDLRTLTEAGIPHHRRFVTAMMLTIPEMAAATR